MAASDMRNRCHVQLLLTWSTYAAHPCILDLQEVKSFLVRAKRPRIQELFQAEATRLEAQIQKLAPPAAAAPRPTICSVSKILTYGPGGIPITAYIFWTTLFSWIPRERDHHRTPRELYQWFPKEPDHH
ncbi:hypothetical protein LAZ67_X001533 [Cordylochernes scorpioides]|uniref:Siah interacting protein N-terminal domain-containing protein n=1 Tax=Cordylochernes scorpioides TaxID=51811 RepID=A0ABY6LVP5_9ARAC|nr:hypothetical protein LAZ67_X001533 [Cordylochernes scorpioides]